MAIIDAAQFDRMLRGLRKRHPRAAALAEDAPVGNVVMFRADRRVTWRRSSCSRVLHSVRHRIRRPRHGMGGLAAAGDTGKRQILRGIAPDDIAHLPRHAEYLRTCAMDIDHRFRSQIADSRVEADPALGSYDHQPIESDRAADITAKRYADAAHLGADPLWAGAPPFRST